jgi:hypothetical protein
VSVIVSAAGYILLALSPFIFLCVMGTVGDMLHRDRKKPTKYDRDVGTGSGTDGIIS